MSRTYRNPRWHRMRSEAQDLNKTIARYKLYPYKNIKVWKTEEEIVSEEKEVEKEYQEALRKNGGSDTYYTWSHFVPNKVRVHRIVKRWVRPFYYKEVFYEIEEAVSDQKKSWEWEKRDGRFNYRSKRFFKKQTNRAIRNQWKVAKHHIFTDDEYEGYSFTTKIVKDYF